MKKEGKLIKGYYIYVQEFNGYIYTTFCGFGEISTKISMKIK